MKFLIPFLILPFGCFGQAFTLSDPVFYAFGPTVPPALADCAFDPQVVSSTLEMWFKLDPCPDYTTNTAFRNIDGNYQGYDNPVDGEVVSVWGNTTTNDSFDGFGLRLVGAGQSTSPGIYRLGGGPNGKNAIDFEGVSAPAGMFLPSGPIPTVTTHTHFIVFKSVRNTGNKQHVFGDGSTGECVLAFDPTFSEMYGNADLQMAACPTITNWTIATAVFNGANSYLRTNGVLVGSGNAGNPTIGIQGVGYGSFGQTLDGRIAEYIVIAGTMTTNDLQGVEDNLGAKYGITVY